MADYLHGAYGRLDESVVSDATSSETVPVYFGTAPVGLVRGWEEAGAVNEPVRVSSLADARAKIGYSDDFGAYTLCEAVAAHFDSGEEGVGPIFVVNVLDPARHRKDADTEVEATFSAGRASIATDRAIIDTLRIERPAPAGASSDHAARADDPAYTKALAASGVSFEGGVFSWDGSPIDPALVHDGIAYIGVTFPVPDGATSCAEYIDGALAAEIDGFDEDGDDVAGGMPVVYFPFATASGDASAYGPRVYEVSFEWDGGSAGDSTYLVGRGTLDYIEGTDYTVSCGAGGTVEIASIDGRVPDGAAAVAYREMDPSKVTAADVVGGAGEDGSVSGIEAVALLYQEQFVVPNLLAAPGWSQAKDVYDALVARSSGINGHWDALVVADLPVADGEGVAVDTIDKAIAWKDENGYSSERSVALWPMATDLSGRRVHLSSLFVAASQRVDQGNAGVPFETPSNKDVPVRGQYFGGGSRNRGFDQQTANRLNERGIATVVGWAGAWVLWGPHTAAYRHGDPGVDPRATFAASMRMLMHITNSFQQEWAGEVDAPMTRALRDRIVNREQEKLDGYVTMGALVGEPRCRFVEAENPDSSVIEGDFRWDIAATPTPPLKSATAYVAYTDAGLTSYFEEGGDEQ